MHDINIEAFQSSWSTTDFRWDLDGEKYKIKW